MTRNNAALFWIIGGLFLAGLMFFSQPPAGTDANKIAYSDFLAEVENGQVADVTLQGQELEGRYENGGAFRTFVPEGSDVVGPLRENGVRITAEPEPRPSLLWSLLVSALPILLLIGAWIFLMRRMSGPGGPGGVMSFGKS